MMVTEAPRFARLRQMLRDKHVVERAGGTVRLRCRADAVPPPSVVWIKDGRLLVTSSRWTADGDDDGDDVVDGDDAGFVLRLSSVTADDAGLYTCRVFNDAGHINFTYTVQVTGLSLSPHPVCFCTPSSCSCQLLIAFHGPVHLFVCLSVSLSVAKMRKRDFLNN